MASRNLKDLTPAVQEKAQFIINECKSKGVDILIYCTLRSLEEQARIWRQSRSKAEINAKMVKYRQRGFGYLADIVESVGPQNGPHVTDACAGESWHNYAEAVDGVPTVGGKAMWSYNTNKKLWDIFGNVVKKAGMEWGGNWTRFKDYPHAQLRPGGNPLKVFTPEQIKEILTNNGLIK